MTGTNRQLGFVGLASIVFGSMIGSGIYNIVQNMAAGASAGAVIVSWLITAAGMLMLVYTFKTLSDQRPDLNAGIYQYAQVGFGNYVGFNIGWGYWLCTAFANVAYAVMLNDAVGVYCPELLEHGWWSLLFGSAIIWVMYLIVIRGIRSATALNVAVTVVKILSLALIVIAILAFFSLSRFEIDLWGAEGTLWQQARDVMPVNLWCFIGIEGACMMSARAKRPSDVGRAGIAGFALAWLLYALVSVMAYGVVSKAEMAQYPNPSVAYLLRDTMGAWAYHFVIISVIVALFGGWISWTLICAQVPYEAARQQIFPKMFLHLNRHGVPSYGLLIASVIMQLFFIVVLTAEEVYMTAIEISGMMVLPAYLFSGIFMVKAASRPARYLSDHQSRPILRYLLLGVLCTVYCLWMIYAGGLDLMMMTSLFYLPGLFFYIKARREWAPDEAIFTRTEYMLLYLIGFFVSVSVPILVP